MTTEVSDEEYFGAMKLMFQSEGWRLLMEELRSQVPQIESVEDCRDSDDLFFRKGQLATIASLLNFEDTIERAEADSEESSQED